MENKKKIINYIIELTIFGLTVRYGYGILQKFKLVEKYYFEFPETFLFVVSFELCEVMIIFLSFILFFILFRENPIQTRISQHIQKLEFKNKIFFTWFTILFAIPNKILINNQLSVFKTSLIVFLLLVISNIFPIFILFYLIFWITILESYFFSILYKEKKYFKTFMNKKLFGDNLSFSEEYFNFFWGNMSKGSIAKGWASLFGTSFGGLYWYSRNSELEQLRKQTDYEMARHLANSIEKPQTVEDSLRLQKKIEDHIRDRDLFLLSNEAKAKEAVKALEDYISGNG